jgi:hypothetical protein
MTGPVLEDAMPSLQFALRSPNSVLQCGRIFAGQGAHERARSAGSGVRERAGNVWSAFI